MTPEEVAANSNAILQTLGELGVTPQMALQVEGRQLAGERYGPIIDQARQLGQPRRVAAFQARVERDATAHARREWARLASAGAAGIPVPAPEPTSVAPTPPQAPSVVQPNALLSGVDFAAVDRNPPPMPATLGPAPAPAAEAAPHHSTFQPRVSGRFSGPPAYPQPADLGPAPPSPVVQAIEAAGQGIDYRDPTRGPSGPPAPSGIVAPLLAGRMPQLPSLTPYSGTGSTVFGPNEVVPTAPNALMPQTPGEHEFLQQQREGSGNLATIATALPATRAGRILAGEAGSVINALAAPVRAAPRAMAAATLGGAITAGATEAEPPSELDRARSQLTALQTRQAELNKAQEALTASQAGIDRILGGDLRDPRINDELKALQRRLGLRDDGALGPLTREAVQRERQRIATALAANATDRGTIGGEITRQDQRVESLRRQSNRDTVVEDAPWIDRMVHRYSGPLGFVSGLVGGNAVTFPARAAATRGVNAATASRVEAANALLTRPSQDIPGRMAGVNAFYQQGGGREPFRLAPRAAGGFTETARTPTPAGQLYPPRTVFGSQELASWVHPADTAPMLAMGGFAGYQEINLYRARQELDAARTADQAENTRQSAERLRAAETAFDYANLRANITRGAPLTYPIAAAALRYQQGRPDVQRGEAEVARLSRWRRRQ